MVNYGKIEDKDRNYLFLNYFQSKSTLKYFEYYMQSIKIIIPILPEIEGGGEIAKVVGPSRTLSAFPEQTVLNVLKMKNLYKT